MASTTSSLGHIATDPLRNFKFQVSISHPKKAYGGAKLGFMSVSGLNITTEVIAYREGGMNTTTQKMPGQSDFAPITLSKGVIIGDQRMLDWMLQIFSVQQGAGTKASGADFRATMVINVMDHPVTMGPVPVKAAFKVFNAWPTAVAFSDLDAGANAILVQQMTLAHEGFQYKLASRLGPTNSVTF